MMRKKKNFLDFIVFKNSRPQWRKTEAGLAQISILRDGLVDRAVRIFKNTPRAFVVELDEFGSFVWEAADGEKTVFEIGVLLKERFGADIEPIYERLAVFLRILKNNRLIQFAERKADHSRA
jgi:hypothetical protein